MEGKGEGMAGVRGGVVDGGLIRRWMDGGRWRWWGDEGMGVKGCVGEGVGLGSGVEGLR